MKNWFYTGVLCLAAAGSCQAATKDDEAFALLQRMAEAAYQLNYAGSFIYEHNHRMETSHIAHLKNAHGEFERLDLMDGNHRQVYRNNDEVYCFLADDKTVMVDKQRHKRSFPALLPDQIANLKDYYDIKLGPQERVAGRDSQVIILAPKDAYRYGRRFWADLQTGLLLKAQTWTDQKETVDQFVFSNIKIGGPIDSKEVRPALRGKKLLRSVSEDQEKNMPVDPGWEISSIPAGFQHMMAAKRVLPGGKMPVNHVVFSDGLAAVSVFIEPASDKSEPGFSSQGAVNLYTRVIGEHQVTVLGEVPKATVLKIGDAVSFRK